MRPRRDSRRSGFTALEAMIALALFGVLMSGFLLSFTDLERFTNTTKADYQLVESSFRIMNSVEDVLSRAGYETIDGTDYPIVFGTEDALDAEHAAFEGLEGILLRLPADADDDGWPDSTAAGTVVWDPETVGIVLVPGADGRSSLELRSTDGTRRVFGRNVVSVDFETPAAAEYSIPLTAMKVRLEVAARARAGTETSMLSESVFPLSNGGLAP